MYKETYGRIDNENNLYEITHHRDYEPPPGGAQLWTSESHSLLPDEVLPVRDIATGVEGCLFILNIKGEVWVKGTADVYCLGIDLKRSDNFQQIPTLPP